MDDDENPKFQRLTGTEDRYLKIDGADPGPYVLVGAEEDASSTKVDGS